MLYFLSSIMYFWWSIDSVLFGLYCDCSGSSFTGNFMTGILEIKTFYRNSYFLERVSTPQIRAKSSIPFQPYRLVGVLILVSNQSFLHTIFLAGFTKILCRNPNRLYGQKFEQQFQKNGYPAIGTKRTWVLDFAKDRDSSRWKKSHRPKTRKTGILGGGHPF